MSKSGHKIYIISLFVAGIGITLLVGAGGFRFYTTAPETRATIMADLDSQISGLDVEQELMKEGLGTKGLTEDEIESQKAALSTRLMYWKTWTATGLYGHGFGIIGSMMMIIGVAMYSTRKRVKRFRFAGKIKYFLEFHIFLCLVGPMLVIFHSTFKFGGIVSVSLWSMIFVALSGIAGRYIYTKIPKTTDGEEVSLDELEKENQVLRMRIKTRFHVEEETLNQIDALGREDTSSKDSVLASVVSLIQDDFTRRRKLRQVQVLLVQAGIPGESVAPIVTIARNKALLQRKISFLGTARALFHYWHVIHVPFSIIMFLILIVHVVLTVSLGYTWIF